MLAPNPFDYRIKAIYILFSLFHLFSYHLRIIYVLGNEHIQTQILHIHSFLFYSAKVSSDCAALTFHRRSPRDTHGCLRPFERGGTKSISRNLANYARKLIQTPGLSFEVCLACTHAHTFSHCRFLCLIVL